MALIATTLCGLSLYEKGKIDNESEWYLGGLGERLTMGRRFFRPV